MSSKQPHNREVEIPEWLHPSLRATFVPLPLGQAMTQEQIDHLFPIERRRQFARELARLITEREAETSGEGAA